MHHNNSLEVNKTCCKCHYNSVLCDCGSLGVQGTVFSLYRVSHSLPNLEFL